MFFYSCTTKAENSGIVINEILTGNEDSTKNEFVELYNNGNASISLTGYRLMKKTENGSEYTTLVSSAHFLDKSINVHGYFVIAHPQYKDAIGADIDYSSSSYSIAANNTIALFNDNQLVDIIGYGSAKNVETKAAIAITDKQSFGRIDGIDTDNNYNDFFLLNLPSPGKENKKLEEKSDDKPINLSDKIIITELLPDPGSGDEEYIELYNGSDEKINLDGWSLHDASKSGEYIFSSVDFIESKKYFVVYKSDFKFALNDSGDESVTLFDPNKKEVFKVSYNGSKQGISYNFNGKDWHWSKFLTPGKENIFEKVPAGDLDIDEDVYVDVYANFEILGLSDNAKVDWDFGDGHGSSLQKTRHKYAEIGKYDASVKYSEGAEDVVKNFTVDVGEVPHPKVKIIYVNANPKGSDTENETITLQNNSKKKVNLNGWSIATGWKKLINHPVSVDFEIKAGKEKEITREFSKFTLNNTKDKIELRYPDGEVAYKMKYKKEGKGIVEGELYVKTKGGWAWQNKNVESIKYNVSSINTENTIINNQEDANSDQEDIKNNEEKISDEEIILRPKIERENKLAMNDKNIFKIELANYSPRVLGAETVREVDGVYHFTPEHPQEEHYAITFLKNIFTLINLEINTLVNYSSI